MISKLTITSSVDAARYHDSALVEQGQAAAQKADNYYANETALATWEGEGAKLLGIQGEKVDREDFINFLEGKLINPKDGSLQDLGINSKGDDRRLGYDFTISPPKSVSMVALVGNGDDRIVQAHHVANRAAMEWLQEHGAQMRVKDENGNNRTVNTGNLMYATVQHETSRANDPDLHNHNVILGITYDKEKGTWRSLTNDELFVLRQPADAIYKNTLAIELRKAGYELDYADNGRDFEIRGITADQIKHFSERSQQIEEALLKQGIDPSNASHAARQAAALDSRAKKVDLPKAVLHEIWNEKAKESGMDLDRVVAESKAVAATRGQEASPSMRDAHAAVGRAIDHLSSREQSFKVAELEVSAIYFGSDKSGIEQIRTAIAERKTEKSLVDRDDKKVRMLTTSVAIAQELTLQDSILQGKGKGVPVIEDNNEFSTALGNFEARKTEEIGKPFKLSAEQVNAARNILMHSDKFQGIQGDAGTGKTAALEFVQEAVKSRGWKTLGIATSSTGAKELQGATGIESQTVAAFMIERDKQLKMLRTDIDKLAIKIAHSPGNAAIIKQVEQRELNLSGDASGFGRARYIFDNKNGNVFRSDTGPLNAINVLGHKLTDAGNRQASEAKMAWENAERFSDRFKARASLVGGTLQATVGRHLTTYEQVGTVEAVAARSAHEAAKYRDQVLRNTLVQDLETKTAQVDNLVKTGNAEGKKFLLIMDESSMTGTRESARISEIAKDIGARVVLQGDVKQHGSVAAGRAFMQVQEAGINLSKIEETRRFDNATPQTKRAIKEMKLGNYAGALRGLDTTNVRAADLHSTVAERYMANRDDLTAQGVNEPKVGIVAMTNRDRKASNLSVRAALQARSIVALDGFKKEHLDDPKMTEAEKRFVPSLIEFGVDRMTALKDYRNLGIAREETFKVVRFDRDQNTVTLEREKGGTVIIDPSKLVNFSVARAEDRIYAAGDQVETRANIGAKKDPNRVTNGTRGKVQSIDQDGVTVKWQDGRTTTLDNKQVRHIDHAYAHTSYKEQGVTNDRQIIAVSNIGAKVINREAAYVAASRAKGNTEIVTSDQETMLKNAGEETKKTTAIDLGKNLDVPLTAPTEKAKDLGIETDKAQSRNVDRTEEHSLGL